MPLPTFITIPLPLPSQNPLILVHIRPNNVITLHFLVITLQFQLAIFTFQTIRTLSTIGTDPVISLSRISLLLRQTIIMVPFIAQLAYLIVLKIKKKY